MTFGQVVAAERKKRGMSQKGLAARVLKEDGIPITPQYLNDVERDRRNPPSERLIEQIAERLVWASLHAARAHEAAAPGAGQAELERQAGVILRLTAPEGTVAE